MMVRALTLLVVLSSACAHEDDAKDAAVPDASIADMQDEADASSDFAGDLAFPVASSIESFESTVSGWSVDSPSEKGNTFSVAAGGVEGASGHSAILSFDFPASEFTPAVPPGFTGGSCAKLPNTPCVAAMKTLATPIQARTIGIWIKSPTIGAVLRFRVVNDKGVVYDYWLNALDRDPASSEWYWYVVDLGSPTQVATGATMQTVTQPYAPPTFTQLGDGGTTFIAQVGLMIQPVGAYHSTNDNMGGNWVYAISAGSVAFDNLTIVDAATESSISATPIERTTQELDVLSAPAVLLPGFSPHYTDGFGVCCHSNESNADDLEGILSSMAAAGVKVVRSDVAWKNVETTSGTFVFDAGVAGTGCSYDQFVGMATKLGIRVDVILDYNNALHDWSMAPHPTCSDGVLFPGTTPAQQADAAAWNQYVDATVAHFGTTGIEYEVWNEPNEFYAWCSNDYGTQYAPLLADTVMQIESAAAAQKLASPTVTTAGLAGPDFETLGTILQSGAADGVSAINVHSYPAPSRPEDVIDKLELALSLTRAHFVAKGLPVPPTWMTESGFASSDFDADGNYLRCAAADVGTTKCPQKSDGWSAGGRAVQAIYLARNMLVHLDLGMQQDLLYEYEDLASTTNSVYARQEVEDNFGWVEGSSYGNTGNYAPKPAYYAVKTLTSFLTGRTVDGVVSLALSGAHAIRLHDTRPALILWSEASPAVYSIRLPSTPSSVTATCGASPTGALDDCSGSSMLKSPVRTDASGTYVLVGRSPIYLTF